MFDEDAVGFVAEWRRADGGRCGRGHVRRKRVVLRIDTGDAHLELVRVRCVV